MNMYEITDYDIINGEKTQKRILKPVHARSIAEIDKYQDKLQRRIQRTRTDTIKVLVHYKVPISEHVDWNKPKQPNMK